MRTLTLFLTMLLTTAMATAHPRQTRPLAGTGTDEHQNDPGYGAYRAGYTLVLHERWSEARERFGELLARYPGSGYRDDAQYWSAYALMHQNRKGALEAYRKFMKDHPHSSYYDDAVADLAQIRASAAPPAPPDAPTPPGAASDLWAPAPDVGSRVRDLEREFRRASRNMGRLRISPLMKLRMPRSPAEDDTLDAHTRLRMETVYAIGDARQDEKSFLTLREIALDRNQPAPLRETAVDVIAGFTRFDALGVMVEVARTDTNPDVQSCAIGRIGQADNRTRSVSLLIELFRQLPKTRKEPIRTVFYTIAEVGNDRAVDFLHTVALTHEDYDLRRDAVYYLGSIGGDRARNALVDILKGQ